MCNSANLKEIYSQHWQHIRHIENERLAFTGFYLTFLSIGLLYIFKENGAGILQKYLILILLLFFSILGFHVMVRVLVTFWYHWIELKRITPLLCPNEKLELEEKQKDIENEIKKNERPIWWLNKTYIYLSKRGGLMLPLTLIFPSIYLLGFLALLTMILLLAFKVIS